MASGYYSQGIVARPKSGACHSEYINAIISVHRVGLEILPLVPHVLGHPALLKAHQAWGFPGSD